MIHQNTFTFPARLFYCVFYFPGVTFCKPEAFLAQLFFYFSYYFLHVKSVYGYGYVVKLACG